MFFRTGNFEVIFRNFQVEVSILVDPVSELSQVIVLKCIQSVRLQALRLLS